MANGLPTQAPQGENRPPQKQRKYSWKSVLVTAIILVIVWQLVHVVMQSHGKSSAGGPKNSAPIATPKPTPVPTVTLGGHRVAVGGGPLVVLNPGLVSAGGKVSVVGSGFAPRTAALVYLRAGRSTSKIVGHGRTSRSGTVTTGFTMPMTFTASKATVVVEAGGRQGEATLATPGGMGAVSIVGKPAGKPGDVIQVTARGFSPGERINVYWGRVSGTPVTTLTADSSGNIARASVRVGIAPTGPTTLVLIGTKTHTTATAPYLMLGLYPTTVMHPYAARAGSTVAFRGSGFAPNEPVMIYLDASRGTPALTSTASSGGSFAVNFVLPFGLKGRQTLTAIGNQSRASTSTSFVVLPYNPSAQASTYDALPGTSLSFYAKGFAANEVVLVYAHGQLVSAFRVDSKGSAAAAGRYIVPSGTGPGLVFTLRGQKSGGSATAKVSVSAPAVQVTIPPQPPYVLPPSLGGKPPASHSQSGSPSSSPSG